MSDSDNDNYSDYDTDEIIENAVNTNDIDLLADIIDDNNLNDIFKKAIELSINNDNISFIEDIIQYFEPDFDILYDTIIKLAEFGIRHVFNILRIISNKIDSEAFDSLIYNILKNCDDKFITLNILGEFYKDNPYRLIIISIKFDNVDIFKFIIKKFKYHQNLVNNDNFINDTIINQSKNIIEFILNDKKFNELTNNVLFINHIKSEYPDIYDIYETNKFIENAVNSNDIDLLSDLFEDDNLNEILQKAIELSVNNNFSFIEDIIQNFEPDFDILYNITLKIAGFGNKHTIKLLDLISDNYDAEIFDGLVYDIIKQKTSISLKYKINKKILNKFYIDDPDPLITLAIEYDDLKIFKFINDHLEYHETFMYKDYLIKFVNNNQLINDILTNKSINIIEFLLTDANFKILIMKNSFFINNIKTDYPDLYNKYVSSKFNINYLKNFIKDNQVDTVNDILSDIDLENKQIDLLKLTINKANPEILQILLNDK